MAAPTIIGTPTSSWNASNVTSITIDKPGGIQDGDYLVAFLRSQSPGATTDWTSSGWSRISTAFIANQGGPRLVGIFGLAVPSVASLSAVTSFTFTFTGTPARVIGAIAVVRGVDIASPVGGVSDSYGGTSITNGSRIISYADSTGINSIAVGLFAGELVSGNTNAITISSSPSRTITNLFLNDTANDGTTGTTGSRTALAVVSYPGESTLPRVDAVWGTITGTASAGVILLGTTSSAPTAAFTYSVTGRSVTVNGSTSSDSDGTVASYAWDFGDTGTATGATATHVFSSSGTYIVTLTVTDNSGATGSTTHSVTISSGTAAPTRLGYTFLDPGTANTTMVLDPSSPTNGTAVATGNWMIATLALSNGTASVTPPSGWTVLKSYATVGTLAYAVYARIRQAGDTSYTFTLSSSGTVGAASIMWGAGADPTISNWIIGATNNRTVSTQNTASSLTTTVDHSLVLGFSMERTSATESGITSLSGATEWYFLPQYASSQIQTLDVAYLADVSPAGATAAMTWVYPNAQSTNGTAFQIALPSVAVNQNISIGYPGILRTSGGVNYTGKMFYWDGTEAHDFSTTLVRMFRPETVSHFLTHTPWFAAHRGFSYSYPEETLYGYRGATDWGIKAIEISVQKSADGTFWCFHDATTNRTTGVSGTISSMSDATLAELSNIGTTAAGNPSQPSRPVAKLVDVLDKYAPTHVIIIEDKTYANTTAMLDLMDSYGTAGRPANEIFIWKVSSGSGKATFFDPATARGYHRWAYIFDATMSSEFPALPASGKADMIGMDFNSSDSTLTAAIAACNANGVMPTAHIVSSTTQRDRLLELGMKGIMISNKDVVPPWYNIF